MNLRRPRLDGYLEAVLLAAWLLLFFHLFSERIAHRVLPEGDEGSWMSAAVEFSRGNGFQTRWLEFFYLDPYTLPRPDDYRYPPLVSILGCAFALFGESYRVALVTVAGVFAAFMSLLYALTRNHFGAPVALTAIYLALLSPLQLYWNTRVYSEGLFGAVLAAVLLFSSRFPRGSKGWWAGSGGLVGLLYLVRPNGILLLSGFAWVLFWAAKRPEDSTWNYLNRAGRIRHLRDLPWGRAALGLACFALVASPWWIRNIAHFGNPLHVGGGGGILAVELEEVGTYGAWEYLSRYGLWFNFERVSVGVVRFFQAFYFYEHGLFVLPCALALAAVCAGRRFYDSFAAVGFALTLAACFFYAYGQRDAGLRYFSSFVPFVYAYGVGAAYHWLDRLDAILGLGRRRGLWQRMPSRASPARRWSGWALVTGFLLLPVLHPHRFYERKFSAAPQLDRGDMQAYLGALRQTLGPNRNFLAARLCQLNFLGHDHCIGLQGWTDESVLASLPRALATFGPAVVAYTPEELGQIRHLKVLGALELMGWNPHRVFSNAVGHIFRLERPGDEDAVRPAGARPFYLPAPGGV